MSNSSSVAVGGGGIGLGSLCFIATIVLAILKAVGTISWSWWVVFAPLLGYAALGVVVGGIVLFVFAVIAIIALIASR